MKKSVIVLLLLCAFLAGMGFDNYLGQRLYPVSLDSDKINLKMHVNGKPVSKDIVEKTFEALVMGSSIALLLPDNLAELYLKKMQLAVEILSLEIARGYLALHPDNQAVRKKKNNKEIET